MMSVTGIKKIGATATVAAFALMLAGCGSSSSGGGTATVGSSGSPVAAGNAPSGLNTMSTSIGNVLVDSSGHTVYELVGDTSSNKLCTSSCEAFWPPVKSGGKIMVVNGHPVFTFVQDTAAGQTHGQGVKDTWGRWLALNAKGNPIAAAKTTPKAPASSAPATASSSSSGGGGYGY
jgi:predicted lipoprotein with Yx(FWY)xxD motif